MSVFPDWKKYAVPQKRDKTGCIPTGYELLLRAANIQGINYQNFQDEFDLEYKKIGVNNFVTVANTIKNQYPHVDILVKHFKTGNEKLKFVEKYITNKKPILISLTLTSNGGWHIMPVVDLDKENLFLLVVVYPNKLFKTMKIAKNEFVRRHDDWPGGNDVAFLK